MKELICGRTPKSLTTPPKKKAIQIFGTCNQYLIWEEYIYAVIIKLKTLRRLSGWVLHDTISVPVR